MLAALHPTRGNPALDSARRTAAVATPKHPPQAEYRSREMRERRNVSTLEIARSLNRQARSVFRRIDWIVAGRTVSAEAPAVMPWQAASELSSLVGALLDRRGVEHWAVEPRYYRVTMWGIRREDWARALAGLRQYFADRDYRLLLHRDLTVKSVRLKSRQADEADADPDQSGVTGVTLYRRVRELSTGLVSDDAACDLQFWDPTERGTLATLEKGGVVHEVPDRRPVETVAVRRWDGVSLPRPVTAAVPDASETDFKVDAVYLWVDDSDPAWRQRRDDTRRRLGLKVTAEAAAAHRFRDRGELRASLRSLELYAPWIRRIFLVTDQQCPSWLDPDSPRITLVDHREIFSDPSALPSYNSHAISSQVHRIDGLASRYLLMNDDVMFNRPVTPETFFTTDGRLRITLSRSRHPRLGDELLTDLERARGNSARLVERDYGGRVTQLFAHVPVPQSLEVAREVEQLYAAEIAQTLAHPFRSAEDYVISSWLHLYRALYTGRAVHSPVRFAYYDVGRPETRAVMADPTARTRAAVLCVNDVQVGDAEEPSAWLTDWLARRFPVPASFELADE